MPEALKMNTPVNLDNSDDENSCGKRRKSRKKKGKSQFGDDLNCVQPKVRDRNEWLNDYDATLGTKELLPSAKTIAIKNKILEWQRDAPDDKIIVFLNWSKLA